MARGPTSAGVRRILENPFHVLGLPPGCARQEMEREGQKLLGMLELGLASAASYDTPLGPRPRTPELVREAMAALRDPGRRARLELWAAPVVAAPREAAPPTEEPASIAAPWPEAFTLFGWRSR
ncbi:MAG: hypothetical protein R3A51_14895 [Nannocystaceae bacterium]|nr:hypothetical protein [Myxococcales bacterium]